MSGFDLDAVRRRAADGDVVSLYQAGMYELMHEQYDAAVSLLTRASDGGHRDARRTLAQLWLHGKGVPERSVDRAVALLEAAVASGDAHAALRLADVLLDERSDAAGAERVLLRVLELQQDGARATASAGVAAAAAAASGEKPDGDGDGDDEDGFDAAAEAAYSLGHVYLTSDALRNPARAREFLARASHAGHLDATYNLGCMLYAGDGVDADHAEAVRLFELAAGKEHPQALYNLGMMLYAGEGVPKDEARAVKLITRSVYLQNVQAAQAERDADDGARGDAAAAMQQSYARPSAS